MEFEKFVRWCRSNGKRTRTIEKYLWCLNKIPKDILNNTLSLNEWLDDYGFEPATKYTMIASIRTFYRFLKKPESIINEFNFPKLNIKDKITFLNMEQIRKFYDSCINDFEKLIVRLFLETGIRRAVILELTPKDIDWEKGLLTIQADYEGNKGAITYTRDLSPFPFITIIRLFISTEFMLRPVNSEIRKAHQYKFCNTQLSRGLLVTFNKFLTSSLLRI